MKKLKQNEATRDDRKTPAASPHANPANNISNNNFKLKKTSGNDKTNTAMLYSNNDIGL